MAKENLSRSASGGKKAAKSSAYGADQITVLEGLDPVRKRPGMYIGNTASTGLHHLIWEVVDNGIDEAMAGHADTIEVRLLPEGKVSVSDNGRGIPVDTHKVTKKSALETVMTTLHAGGKFGDGGYKVSGGLHGVGVSCVNALSEWLEVEIKRDGKIYNQRFERGEPSKPKAESYKGKETGTIITFMADPEIFTETTVYTYDTVKHRLQELAFLNKGLKIVLIDEREKEKKAETFEYEGGVVEFIDQLGKGKTALYKPIVAFSTEKDDVFVEVGLQHFKDYYDENVYSYVNCIRTKEGGTHVVGFKSALTRVVNTYGHKNGILKENENIQGEDIREGLTAVINTRIPNPQFEGQTKTKLGNGEVKGIVDSVVVEGLSTYLDKNPAAAKLMIEKSLIAYRVRMAARKAQELERKKSALDTAMLPGKLADCTATAAAKCELFIVEGDSAGGSAKQGRDRMFQAILPLRGKILNVEKSRLDKILANNEIRTMITAIGPGVITGLKAGSDEKDEEMTTEKLLKEFGREGAHIQRYKGLGEMNPTQLWDTTMNPATRTILQVTLEDGEVADEIFTILMGSEVEPRRKFIEDNAKEVKRLDI